MLEDALKATRTLHRLITTVSLVALVFAFSLVPPDEKIEQMDAIEYIMEADIEEYRAYLGQVERQEHGKQLEKLKNNLEQDSRFFSERFETNGWLSSLAKPAGIRRPVIVREEFTEMPSVTLGQLSIHEDYGFGEPPVLYMLDPVVLSRDLLQLLTTSGLDSEQPLWGFEPNGAVVERPSTDELREGGLVAVRVDGYPTPMNFEVPMERRELQEATLHSWLGQGQDVGALAEVLDDVPLGRRRTELDELYQTLAGEVDLAGPGARSVAIVGTEVPGRLIAFAAPLALLILGYYLAVHTVHLRHIAHEDAEEFKQFAWMPLALRTTIPVRVPGTRHRSISVWSLETAAGTIGLPSTSLGVLYWQLSAFGEIDLEPVAVVMGVAGFGIATCGVASIVNIRRVRNATNLGQK